MSRSPALGEPRQALTSQGPIKYRERGEGEPILLFHEWSTNADTWRKVVPELSTRYRMIAPDWPYGTHEAPMLPDADLSSPGLARIVIEFLDELGIEQATFACGGGTTVAYITAGWHPDRAARLFLGTGDALEHFPAPKLRPYARLGSIAPTAWAFAQVRRFRWAQRRYYDRVAKHGVAPEAMESYCAPLARNRLARRDVRRALRGIRCEY